MREGLEYVCGRMSWFLGLTSILLRESWTVDSDFTRLTGAIEKQIQKLFQSLLEFEMTCVCSCASPWKAAALDMVGWKNSADTVASIKEAEVRCIFSLKPD